MSRSSWFMALAVGAAAVLACGCADFGAGKVTGSVKLNGRPRGDAEVRFCPKDDSSLPGNSAKTDADGSFQLGSHPSTGKTLGVGHYVVLVSKMVQKNGTVPPAEDAGMLVASGAVHNSLPHIYDEFEKSPFKVEITKGDNTLAPFELKSN